MALYPLLHIVIEDLCITCYRVYVGRCNM